MASHPSVPSPPTGGGAPSTTPRATILTPRWRKLPPAVLAAAVKVSEDLPNGHSQPGDTDASGQGPQLRGCDVDAPVQQAQEVEDMSDETFLKRHEHYAVEERGRWTPVVRPVGKPNPVSTPSTPQTPAARSLRSSGSGVSAGRASAQSPPLRDTEVLATRDRQKLATPVSSPGPGGASVSRKRARISVPMLPLFPTPLECFQGVQEMLAWWERETVNARQNAFIAHQQRRESYAASLEETIAEYMVLHEEVTRQKLRLEQIVKECMENVEENSGEFLDNASAWKQPLDCFEKVDQVCKKQKRIAEKAMKQSLEFVEGSTRVSSPASPMTPSEDDPSGPPSDCHEDATPKPPNDVTERFLPPEGYVLDGKSSSTSLRLPRKTATLVCAPGVLSLPPSTIPVTSPSVEKRTSPVPSPQTPLKRIKRSEVQDSG